MTKSNNMRFDKKRLYYRTGLMPIPDMPIAHGIDGADIVYDGYSARLTYKQIEDALIGIGADLSRLTEDILFTKMFVNELIKQNQYVAFEEINEQIATT